MDSNMTIAEFLVSVEGRITRSVLWRRFFLPLAVTWLIVRYMQFVMDARGASSVVGVLFFLLAGWPLVAVSVKRLHDRNKSGWWLLVAVVPVAGWLWYVVDVAMLEGTRGPNRFGADHLERRPAE